MLLCGAGFSRPEDWLKPFLTLDQLLRLKSVGRPRMLDWFDRYVVGDPIPKDSALRRSGEGGGQPPSAHRDGGGPLSSASCGAAD